MKVLQTATVLGVACAALVAADKGFRPPAATNGTNATTNSSTALDKFKKIKTVANFGKSGAKMEVCPSGDCTNGQSINLALSRLEEYTASGQLAVKAENFNTADAIDWSDFVQSEVNGVAVSSTSYLAKLDIKDKGAVIGTVALNVTASIFAANGTTMNGNQSVPVPVGGLKFTLAISDWPFRATTDSLRFALTLKAKAKADGTNPKALAQPEKKKLNGTAAVAKIDRVDFGEGMFMDAPSVAVLDGVSTDITASVEAGAGGVVEYVWVFPSFKKTLFYDPVVGSTDVSAQTTTDTTATTPTTAPVATTATPAVTPTAATTPSTAPTTPTTPQATTTSTSATTTPTSTPTPIAPTSNTTTSTSATTPTTTSTATTTPSAATTSTATTSPATTSTTTSTTTTTPTTKTPTTATPTATTLAATTTTPTATSTATTKTPTVTPTPTSSASGFGPTATVVFAGIAAITAFAWM
ncbi:hypothetical protein PybrP1_001930 [[Pythium] brassicae (nom. inval.)]|nr:hypothetical protein PybrP1_001930 [[Pythium] brassicae (nom. inval.)]